MAVSDNPNNYLYCEKFKQEWTDLQLIFWEARREITRKRYTQYWAHGYEVCHTSSACWVRRRMYEDE